LAILFPNVEFTLVDSIGKKITVVKGVAESLGLKNVKAYHERAEKIKDKFHFVVSRAVTQMPVFLRWLKGKFEKEQFNPKHNGVLYLKGGDLGEELAGIKCEIFELKNHLKRSFLTPKKLYIYQKEILIINVLKMKNLIKISVFTLPILLGIYSCDNNRDNYDEIESISPFKIDSVKIAQPEMDVFTVQTIKTYSTYPNAAMVSMIMITKKMTLIDM
jgi:hypothetical protein